jgi:YHS domain-containing protein
MRRTVLAVVLIAIVATVSITALAQAKKAEKPEKARDVVCGMMVDKHPDLSVRHNGETFYFCSRADMEKFKKEPQKYVKK